MRITRPQDVSAAYALRFLGIEINLAGSIFAASSRPTPGTAEKVFAATCFSVAQCARLAIIAENDSPGD
jgi:hypothetical protein